MSKTLSTDRITREIDEEVHKVARTFRFILKYRKQFQPSGVEFSELRKYRAEDDASRIDWKSSTRLNDLYVKEYDEEKDLDVFILFDASSTMTFGTAEKLKSEYAALLASTLSYASVDSGIDVGIGIFGDSETFITPDSGQPQYRKVLNEVSKSKNYGGNFNLKKALKTVNKEIKSKTFLFIISDFIEEGEDWKSEINIAASKFEHVLTMMVRDLRDYKLPDSGNFRFKSPGDDQMMVTNTSKIKEEFNKEAREKEKEIKEKARNNGAEFLKIDTRDSFAAELMTHFSESDKW